MGIIDKAAQNLTQVVSRASEAFAPNVEIDPAEKSPFIAEKQEDFCIPQTLRDLLTPSLAELGFRINQVALPGLPGTPPGLHNVIQNAAGYRSLLHFPKEVLTEPLVWQSVANVFQRFQLKDQTLLILSQGLDSTHPFYVAVGEKVWQSSYRITAPFLPWNFLIPSPPNPPLAASDLLSVLPALLRLEELITKAQALPPVSVAAPNITAADVATLANILGNLTAFFDNGERGWRLVMNAAGLTTLIGELNISGANNETIAFGVITQLKGRRALDAYPEDPVLGRFLYAIVTTMPDLPINYGDQIKTVLRTYNLVPKGQTLP
jgi:hypothetical protein